MEANLNDNYGWNNILLRYTFGTPTFIAWQALITIGQYLCTYARFRHHLFLWWDVCSRLYNVWLFDTSRDVTESKTWCNRVQQSGNTQKYTLGYCCNLNKLYLKNFCIIVSVNKSTGMIFYGKQRLAWWWSCGFVETVVFLIL